jgi:hypothetical protein
VNAADHRLWQSLTCAKTTGSLPEATAPDLTYIKSLAFRAQRKWSRWLGNVNRSLSGRVNYLHYRNSNQVMEKVKTHAEQRMGSSQSRVAKIEAGAPAESLDLIARALLAAGATRQELRHAFGPKEKLAA